MWGGRASVEATAAVGCVADSYVAPPPPGALEVLAEVTEFAGHEIVRRFCNPLIIAIAKWDWKGALLSGRPRSKRWWAGEAADQG